MKVWPLDYEGFVKVNGIEPITNPIMFDKGGVPTVDGLFSSEIFGVTNKDRKETWGYIDLKGKYLAPKIYISLKKLNRIFESVVYGTKKFSINHQGVLVEDENGGTGLDWLYKNWESIKFEKNQSVYRNERVDLLTNTKKEMLFTSKEVVIPVFFRDINTQTASSNPRVPEINDLYAKIIRNVKMISDANNMDFITLSLRGKVQDSLVDVYNILKQKVEKKHGYIRSFLMGKSIDYSSRVVITATPQTAERPSDMEVDFRHAGVPLAHVCAQFTPFILWWTKRWFKSRIEDSANGYPILNDKGEKCIVKLDNPEAYFNDDYVEDHLANFVDNPYTRFDTIDLPVSDEELKRVGYNPKKGKPKIALQGFTQMGNATIPRNNINKDSLTQEVNRYLTWTDIFYMAASDVTADKHVIITRYPMLDYNGSFIARIFIISTRDTMPMMINGTVYPHYPIIDLNAKKRDLESMFRDTININPLYLKAMDGDHDGDQITCKGIFSQEANEECERLIEAKINLLSITGNGIRTLGNEAAQTLYSVTRFR